MDAFKPDHLLEPKWLVLDGCSSGWVAATVAKQSLKFCYIDHLDELKQLKLSYVFVDMPLKLPSSIHAYPRPCDKAAKQLLGRFHASVFYAPLNTWLTLSFKDINTYCQLHHKAKLSKQSFYLFPKIKELQDYALKAKHSLLEIHPERIVHSFLGHQKLSKKTAAGSTQRISLLNTLLNTSYTLKTLNKAYQGLKHLYPQAKVQKDDCLDAGLVACAAHLYFKNKLAPQHSQAFSHFFDKNVKLIL